MIRLTLLGSTGLSFGVLFMALIALGGNLGLLGLLSIFATPALWLLKAGAVFTLTGQFLSLIRPQRRGLACLVVASNIVLLWLFYCHHGRLQYYPINALVFSIYLTAALKDAKASLNPALQMMAGAGILTLVLVTNDQWAYLNNFAQEQMVAVALYSCLLLGFVWTQLSCVSSLLALYKAEAELKADN